MKQPRISYVPYEDMDEAHAGRDGPRRRDGTPRPETNAIRAHVPAAFWAFAEPWETMFRNGVCDHAIKELCRVYISRTVTCEFCGNQRSERGASEGLSRASTTTCSTSSPPTSSTTGRRRPSPTPRPSPGTRTTATACGTGCTRTSPRTSWSSSGCVIALTFGQQSWIRLLDVDHHQYMAGPPPRWRPGFEDAEALAASKAKEDYWAAGSETSGDRFFFFFFFFFF